MGDVRRIGLDDPGATDARLVGRRGADVALLAGRGLPVPPAYTLTTVAGRHYLDEGWDAALDTELTDGVADLERATGRRLGDPDAPLLVSIRPSSPSGLLNDLRMPVLNLGLDAAVTAGLAARAGDRFAMETWLLFIRHFATVVLGAPAAGFDDVLDAGRRFSGSDQLPGELLGPAASRFLAVADGHGGLPDDPAEQLRLAVRTAFGAWRGTGASALRNRAGVGHDGSLAVTVQAMVFGHLDERSGSGTVWSRHPSSGEPGAVAGERFRTQGGDNYPGLVAGPEVALADAFPDHAERLRTEAEALEDERVEVVGVDYTIEGGTLWVLGTRTGRAARPALRVLVDAVERGRLSRRDAVERLAPSTVERALHGEVDTSRGRILTTGLGASPGVASGAVVFDADAAARRSASGEAVILVRAETSPEDVHGMSAAAGILTTRGGLASHAAVVARGWGTPAVCGAEGLELGAGQFRAGEVVVAEGDVVSIDGGTGRVLLGALDVAAHDVPAELETVLAWADDVRAGHLGVRANADTAADARRARSFGAEGIGLCRTEHMFLAEDRLPIVREMILADGEAGERRALRKLRRAQREDFTTLLEAMDGLPVTVRLLDPPLHEFLPDVAELTVREATGTLADGEAELLAAAREWSEANPMIGTRGVRLGVLKPGLYQMQVQALLEAVAERVSVGGRPVVEVMIPLTVTGAELAEARGWVEAALADRPEVATAAEVRIGTMIETPRAALCAAELAAHADFFSFGTNDLTQLTFGFSRDDVEARLMAPYLDRGLLAANPFEHLDEGGVGELVRLAVARGREAAPDLKLGVCGEHGGDARSVAALLAAGVDYVSCSPFRVPVARLAAARAVIGAGGQDRQ